MHNRLKQFLTMENISPARFAEELGIQRSGISHLLSGRNKPSFEFLQKMMSAYPDLNAEWLILGKAVPSKATGPSPKPMSNRHFSWNQTIPLHSPMKIFLLIIRNLMRILPRNNSLRIA